MLNLQKPYNGRLKVLILANRKHGMRQVDLPRLLERLINVPSHVIPKRDHKRLFRSAQRENEFSVIGPRLDA
jgi:hypothetical protein